MKKILGFSAMIMAQVLFFACNPLDPAQEIPSYIAIDTISFEVTDPDHQTSHQKISDAWVYVNDVLIGAYELPVTLPVLAEGKQNVMVFGGIKVNGIAATRAAYPFFQGWAQTVDLKLKETVKLKPVANYSTSTFFRYSTDFENELDLVSLPDGKANPVLVTSNQVLNPEINGLSCAGITLDATNNRFSVRQKTDTSLWLPTGGKLVFMELSYKCNHPFSVGVIASYPTGDEAYRVMTINPSENWNKIYVNLTSVVSENFQAKGYNIMFFAEREENIAKGEIYLDNIKVVY